MRIHKKWIVLLLTSVMLMFSGCMRTVDQMYTPPKRSEEFTELQTAIDKAMTNMVYCAPTSGENQQTVQSADLNGDGIAEYLLFAKGDSEHPLQILIFQQIDDNYELIQTIDCNGTAFDMVEYVQMDQSQGMELVVGTKLADRIMKSVSVFTFHDMLNAELLVCTSYSECLTTDIDGDNTSELFVLKPGQLETDNGIAEIYEIKNGVIERSNEMGMSGPVNKLKRILAGKIHDGIPAVYVATTVDDTALITDVYAYIEGKLVNVTFTNESGTSVKTIRNYYVYADDIDNDGVVELPYLLPMMPMEDVLNSVRQELIRWYALTADGKEVVKTHTYHNYVGGWYIELGGAWASRLTVVSQNNSFVFYLWDDRFENAEKLMTVFVLSGQNRLAQVEEGSMFMLQESSTITYAAKLEQCAADYGITEQSIINSFHMIRQDWKTGEK